MSRVHDALRRAERTGALPVMPPPAARPTNGMVPPAPPAGFGAEPPYGAVPSFGGNSFAGAPVYNSAPFSQDSLVLDDLLSKIEEIPFRPLADAHLIDPSRPNEAPAEEFRTLRTRLNHMQTMSPIHTLVVTSPSPAEGKSFTAVNLALAQSHLANNLTLIGDFDFRRPILHTLFQVDRSPGITDYLLGKAQLHEVIKKVAGTNLYIMPAGEAVLNPLELLNLKEVKQMLDQLPQIFNWVILDTPPLLFAADATLLSTIVHGTLLVVRIGATTIDSVVRAMQSLCENNVVGIAVNGARRGELYSRYTYYHSYYYSSPEPTAKSAAADDDE